MIAWKSPKIKLIRENFQHPRADPYVTRASRGQDKSNWTCPITAQNLLIGFKTASQKSGFFKENNLQIFL